MFGSILSARKCSRKFGRAIALASAVAALAIALGVGCGRTAKRIDHGPPETPVTPDEELALRKIKSGDTAGAARIYANLGEGVFFDHGPAIADPLFDKALAQDPGNSKALFYTSFTKPLVTMSGFLPRAEGILYGDDPYYESHARNDLSPESERAKTDSKATKTVFPELNDWAYTIPAGKAPFGSLHEVQRFLRTELLPVLDTSLANLSRIDPANPPALLISFRKFHPHDPVLQGKESGQRGDEANLVCKQRLPGDGTWYCAPDKKSVLPRTVTLDRSDLRVITHGVRAIGDYIRLNTAYSTEGWDSARLTIHEHNASPDREPVTVIDTTSIIHQYPNLFTLESDQLLSQIKDSTFSALEDAEDLHAMASAICSNVAGRIKANALFSSICVYNRQLEAVATGIEVLNGPAEISLGRDPHNPDESTNRVMIVVDVPRILNNPPKDLKPLFATQFGQDGSPIGFPDATLGGLFPNGDFQEAYARATRRAAWNHVPQRMKSYGIVPFPFK